MDAREMRRTLDELWYANQLATQVADAAMPRAADLEAVSGLGDLREDHERHVRELTDLLLSFGRVPAEPTEELEESLTEMLAVARGASDSEGAREAVVLAEEALAARYADAAEADVPVEVASLLTRHGEDERRHASSAAATKR